MKLIKLIDKLLKNVFEGKSKKENALEILEKESKNKGGGLKQLSENNIGQQPLSVVLPHLKMVAETYNLKLSNASDFKIARIILTSWLSKQNSNTYATT
tara:strand:- start:3255 stop:3551 length:297 start_codon:yes stop_codon:yes gene_type:complete